MRIAIVIKTSLDFDGRVISQIDALSSNYPESKITILLLPDKKTTIKFARNVSIKEIKLISRKLPTSAFWQLFKMVEYGITVNKILLNLKPDIIHIHDENSIIGPLIYKLLKKHTCIIYDDHELRNLPPKNIQQRIMLLLERIIYKKANLCIVANESRKKFVVPILKPTQIAVIENWHYKRPTKEFQKGTQKLLLQIDKLKRNGEKIILHQGFLHENRRIDLVEKIVNQLPDEWKMLFIGIPQEKYNEYFDGNKKTCFGGYIFNADLDIIWSKMDAVIIFYNTDDLNNKYCAPNRIFLALNLGIPVIVNKQNPELKKVIDIYKNGIGMEEKSYRDDLNYFFSHHKKILTNALKLKGAFEYQGKIKHPVIKLYKILLK